MAAFSFPQNPQNGDTETNPATGLTYVFVALPSPGKWEVQMRDSDGDFVNVAGDTMTGALDIIPTNPIPASTGDSTLVIQSSPFSAAAENQNYISRVFEAKTNQGHNIFSIRDNDATNLPITQGRISAISCYAADTYVHPTLNSITADDFPTSGLRAGFRIGGRVQGGANGDVLTCTYFASEGTQIQYYGDMLTDNSLVTKKYVDDLSGDESLIHGGTIAAGSEGSISNTGNLAIQKSSAGEGGELFVRSGPNPGNQSTNVFAFRQTGDLELYGTQSIVGTTVSSGQSTPVVNIKTADTIGGTQTAVASFRKSSISLNQTTSVNANLSVGSGYKITCQDETVSRTATFSGVEPIEFTYNGLQYIDVKDKLAFYALKDDGTRPSWDAFTIQSAPDNENFSTAKIGKRFYYSGTYIYVDSSSRKYLQNQNWQTFANDSVNVNADGANLLSLIYTKYDKLTNDPSYHLLKTTNQNIQGVNDYIAGLSINTAKNKTSLWNVEQAGILKFETTNSVYGGTTGLLVNGNSSSPSFTMMYGAPGVSLERVFSFSYSSTYGKRIYLYPDYGQSYNNVANLPDNTPVTLGLLRNQGLVGQALTTINPYSGDPADEGDSISLQTQVNIPAQVEFEGRTTVGRGFTLTGCTKDQPTNTSAVCLRLQHNITSPAELEYLGSTTASNYCVQTKASVPTLMEGRSNVWTGTNIFRNSLNFGDSGHYVFTQAAGVIRMAASAASTDTGLNNGAILVIDGSNQTISALYEDGLLTNKKLVFDASASTQTILLSNYNYKGLNIKHINSSGAEEILAQFKHSGSQLNSPLDMKAYKIQNLGNPVLPSDAANKTYVDTAIAGVGGTAEINELYGAVKILYSDDGTSPSLRIRNQADTEDTFKINTDGSINTHSGITSLRSDGYLKIQSNGTTFNRIQFNIGDGNVSSPTYATVLGLTESAANFTVPIESTEDIETSGALTIGGVLTSNATVNGSFIECNSTSTVSGITVKGSANKQFKVFVGDTGSTRQLLMLGQTNVTLGNVNCDLDFTFETANSTVGFNFYQNQVVQFKFGTQTGPITFAQGEISKIGNLADVSLLTSPSGTNLNLRTVGGSNQQIVLQTTQNDGTVYSSFVLDSNSIRTPGELEIYQNSGGTNGKIYSYGFSRGLEIYAADYNTAKGNAKLTSKFEAGMVSLMTNIICFDNTSAHSSASPNTDITIRVGTGGQGSAAAYPKIDFAWATDTGITYEHNFTMEYTQFTNVPNVVLLNGSRVTQASAPTSGDHLCNKTYVDNKVSSVSVSGTTQDVGTFTLTCDGTGTTPTTKQTISAHYRKIGHIVHVVAHATGLDFTGYAGGSIRLTGLPFQPDDDIPVQIGHIHAVGFMVNNYHADDDQVAVIKYDSTYGSHISVFAGQVTSESTYIPNSSSAQVTISATYIAES